MPKVSVVIPAYNAMGYLPETLASALNQTFVDYEVIIVDDGSKDNIQQWAAQLSDPRVKLISQENQGLSGARNTGIAHAQGEYVAFLDADDLWAPTKLEKQVQLLEQDPDVGLVYTWVASIDQAGQSRGRILKNNAQGYVWKTLLDHNIVECGSTPMVRLKCFVTEGVFDRNLGSFVEDKDMWLRIASRYRFDVVKEALVYYRQHANSASKNWQAMERSSLIVLEKAFNSAPNLTAAELEKLRSQSYGRVYLRLAWKPLQIQNRDYETAKALLAQAFYHCPRLRFSKEHLRLSAAITFVQWFGSERYDKALELLYAVRRRIQFKAQTVKQ
ncbi:glycosyltransferase family 2 protein [Microcoleus sp. FACHB-1515]|uniref:glycosyltransferase family 2 protein n=1 Tax=Cyanophyceae TaxID=3028117 RepID=UPI0016872CC2|nr:glycosyltransferase family A protein [Microcoleus sp. FACHB-1515]MBD2089099.1 glycosyltransferase family 2 protein [Microcoleus sp. FACHB-1515]